MPPRRTNLTGPRLALEATLAVMAPSPAMEVNRAVAVALLRSPSSALKLLHGTEAVEEHYPDHIARTDHAFLQERIEEMLNP
jgi:predicted RNA polymerase sigma factor